ncbi:hypothetical protein C7999DRAFT_44745 [Corynascus novoguineensis]|uniref:DUF7924 domain-containing protein n=1 Tax=Corynascus novoguineensis TaxID=1126955 RepID=A0AAN7HKI9_9PEZI|nr:hypothetical protein C7999DRAFT_44745 [Corynascus novoguineensis]
MAHTRVQTAAQKALPSPASNNQGNRSQGIQPCKGSSGERANRHAKRNRPSPTTSPLPQGLKAPVQSRGRKRKQLIEHAAKPSPDPDLDANSKRQGTSPLCHAEVAFGGPAIMRGAHKPTDPVAFWAKEGRWPEEQDWPEETSKLDLNMDCLLARKKSLSNLRKRSISATSTTPSDQQLREQKSAPYRDPRYRILLETKGSFMDKSELGIIDESKALCQTLLETAQPEPQDSLFRSDIFESTCRNVEDRNEARVIRDITPLIVPSAELLCTYGASYLRHLIESVNEGWNNSIPLTGIRPQPDYSVGFRRGAFTEDQLARLSPFIGDFIAGDQSFFMATYYMYFPFLACEVKCGAAALDIADRQNAHSMTLAVRGIVELFRAVKREDEVNRKILAFSISHDNRSVRIYGHYPVITGKDIRYYRHPIHTFDLTALDGKDRWTAYRFTKNVYDTWMPKHFENICSAIDQLPSNLDFDVPPLSKGTGLSQDLGDLMQSGAYFASAGERDGQSSVAEQQAVTPDTSFSGVKRRKSRQAG